MHRGESMHKNKRFIISILLFFCVGFCCFVGCSKTNPPKEKLGVWCWSDVISDEEFTFLKNNKVNEIYYSAQDFNNNTLNTIKKAKKQNISVYYLCGNNTWIEDNSNLISIINDYIEFNNNNRNNAFDGIHFDVEPHQYEDFDSRKEYYLQKFVEFAYNITTTYPDIKFDFDIPAWLTTKVSFNGEFKETFKYIFDFADRVFVMSYRDTAEAIYDFAEDELLYAKEQNKPIFLCVETKKLSNEEEFVTFFEEGKETMQNELTKLKEMLNQNFGISIHHLKPWINLK